MATAAKGKKKSGAKKSTRKTGAKKATVLHECERCVAVRIYPQNATVKNGDLARAVAEVAQKENWKIEELHTEEGRLDEVFRAITLPDTVKEAK